MILKQRNRKGNHFQTKLVYQPPSLQMFSQMSNNSRNSLNLEAAWNDEQITSSKDKCVPYLTLSKLLSTS